jgi:hypothetical protein
MTGMAPPPSWPRTYAISEPSGDQATSVAGLPHAFARNRCTQDEGRDQNAEHQADDHERHVHVDAARPTRIVRSPGVVTR